MEKLEKASVESSGENSVEFYDILSPKILTDTSYNSRKPRPTFYKRPYGLFPYPQYPLQNYPNQHITPNKLPFFPQNNPGTQVGPQQFPLQFDSAEASEVIDLTSDIFVNQILSEKGAPFHPDAEFISVPNQPRPRPFESYPQQHTPFYFTAFRDIKKK